MTHSYPMYNINNELFINLLCCIIGSSTDCDLTTTEPEIDGTEGRPYRIRKQRLGDHIDPKYFGM